MHNYGATEKIIINLTVEPQYFFHVQLGGQIQISVTLVLIQNRCYTCTFSEF